MAVLQTGMPTRVSLAQLAAADIRLRPAEAVAIVVAICEQHDAGILRGVPSPSVIRLTRSGDVVAEGPITTAQDAVGRAALLLNGLLSGHDALPEYRASGALRLVIERALGTIDLPPYASVAEFCGALARFSTEDVRDVAASLFAAWERAHAGRAFKAAHAADLTISDVRRARRATGLSLGHLATVSAVPSTRLRDLEWGYMRDWPPTQEGRAQVIRYARAAGLDESLVLSIAWPMILERVGAAPQEAHPGVALVRSGPQTLTVVRSARPAHSGRWRRAVVAAAATIAFIGAFALGSRSSGTGTSRQDGAQGGLSSQGGPPAASMERREARTAILPPLDQAPADPPDRAEPRTPVQHALAVQPVEKRAAFHVPDTGGTRVPPRPAVFPKPKPRPAVSSKREERRKGSLFERELFRIVIR